METRFCFECAHEYVPLRAHQKYCSKRCRWADQKRGQRKRLQEGKRGHEKRGQGSIDNKSME